MSDPTAGTFVKLGTFFIYKVKENYNNQINIILSVFFDEISIFMLFIIWDKKKLSKIILALIDLKKLINLFSTHF